MGRRTDIDDSRRHRRPATNPDDREQQLAGLAYDLAEKQLLDGTASATVITQLMKYGSTRELLERQKIEYENQLSQAKREQMESASRMEELYADAIRAMGDYRGEERPEDESY